MMKGAVLNTFQRFEVCERGSERFESMSERQRHNRTSQGICFTYITTPKNYSIKLNSPGYPDAHEADIGT